jgi:hypothetical protein
VQPLPWSSSSRRLRHAAPLLPLSHPSPSFASSPALPRSALTTTRQPPMAEVAPCRWCPHFPTPPPTSFMAGGDKSPNPNINPQGTAVCANPSPSPCCHLTLSWLHHHLFLLRCPPLPRPHPQSDSSTRGSLTAMGSYSCSSGAMRSSRRVSCLISSRDKGEDE